MNPAEESTETPGAVQSRDTRAGFTIVVTECPRCDRSQSVRLRNSVDATTQPDLKEQLLSRALMAHTCVACGAAYRVEYDFLYTDTSRNLAIVLSRGGMARRLADSVPPSRGQHRRLAIRWSQVIEKILAFDAGLDDRVIELVKHGVCRQLLERHGHFLETIGAKPLDIARVSFRGVDRSRESGDRKSDNLEFLMWWSPPGLPVTIRTPFHAAVSRAEGRLAQVPPEPVAPNEWLGVDPQWAVRAVGGLESPSAVDVEIEVAVEPSLLFDPVTRGFLDNVPIAPSGSRRPFRLVRSESRAWRPQHYYFAHRRLRGAFEDPERWVAALHSPERTQLIKNLWDEVSTACLNEGRAPYLRVTGTKVHTARIQGYPTAIIEMTPPLGWCEAFFVALVLRRIGLGGLDCMNEIPKLAYYTLELGQREDGSPCTYLCEWNADGSRSNHGFGPAPNLDDFVEAVTAHVRETSIVREPMPPEVVRGEMIRA